MPGIEAFIASAKTMLRLEQASLPHLWRGAPSPWVSKLIEAASNSAHPVKTQILLNDESVFELRRGISIRNEDPKPPLPRETQNERAARFINEIALCKKIPIEAKIVDVRKLEITYIHNKGMIADNDQVFVSSINGTQNSVSNNREVALHVRSQDAAEYYSRAFDFDWKSSLKKPGINFHPFNDYEVSQCDGIIDRTVSVSPIFSWAWADRETP
jgi:phosphatidylserine/phosphatidylglycerophosphate/cardiolipin synthase-like enzyme